jgi:hypothetical protein
LVSIWGIVILSLPWDKGWYLFWVCHGMKVGIYLGLPMDKGWYLFGACHGMNVGIYLGLAMR